MHFILRQLSRMTQLHLAALSFSSVARLLKRVALIVSFIRRVSSAVINRRAVSGLDTGCLSQTLSRSRSLRIRELLYGGICRHRSLSSPACSTALPRPTSLCLVGALRLFLRLAKQNGRASQAWTSVIRAAANKVALVAGDSKRFDVSIAKRLGAEHGAPKAC